MTTPRRVGTIGHLPQTAFNAGALTWWGMALMMLIEGFTLVLVVFAYLYIRHRYLEWPPHPTPLPTLGVPIATLIVLLASVVPAWIAVRRARVHDRRGVRDALLWQSVLCVTAMVLRYFEFRSLGVRWDTNAYASVAWALIVAHTLLAILDVLDTIGLTLLFTVGEPEEKHLVDTSENSIFWYFVVLAWIPVFALVFLYPRWR
jgi:heme/copper-type cytochrome/quinol oxidase subunit 3